MPEAWRIVKAKHAAIAFSGEGAAQTGGRWNSRGVAVVYASGTQSLAALETLVHLNPQMIFKYVAIRIEFDAAMIETMPLNALPKDWRAQPPPSSTKQLGDAWTRAARSAVLKVPGVIVASEANYLLNPAHLDFRRISIGTPVEFAFDPRLLK